MRGFFYLKNFYGLFNIVMTWNLVFKNIDHFLFKKETIYYLFGVCMCVYILFGVLVEVRGEFE